MSPKDLIGMDEITALLGQGTVYEGKLAFEGRVRIDGRFCGEIFSEGVLIVGETAEIRSKIEVGTLIVRGGAVWGDVRASQLVELHAPGRLYGDVHSPQIFVDKGVVFEGRCIMPETRVATLDGDEPTDEQWRGAQPSPFRAAVGEH